MGARLLSILSVGGVCFALGAASGWFLFQRSSVKEHSLRGLPIELASDARDNLSLTTADGFRVVFRFRSNSTGIVFYRGLQNIGGLSISNTAGGIYGVSRFVPGNPSGRFIIYGDDGNVAEIVAESRAGDVIP
jgi:hypothetical protein